MLKVGEGCTGQPLEELALVDTPSRGVLYLITMAARSTNLAYMEAVIRAYVYGATEPLWLSSGLEDTFLGTYYFQTGRYHTPIVGLTQRESVRTRLRMRPGPLRQLNARSSPEHSTTRGSPP
jgi:hypothetical protein